MTNPCRAAGVLAALLLTAPTAAPQTPPAGGTGAGAGTGTTGGAASDERKADKSAALRLRAFAIDMSNPGAASRSRTLDIVIERWSTDAERDRLRDILLEQGGGHSLLKAVQAIRPRAGYVRGANTLGWDIQFARQQQLPDGGRRIILGSDRPMSFWELANQTRSSDYEFLLADIRIGADGKGEGKLIPAAMVTYDEGTKTIEVENWDTQPVRLTQVAVQK